MLRKLRNFFIQSATVLRVVVVAVTGAVIAVWWAIAERRLRKRTERALEAEKALAESNAKRLEAISTARRRAYEEKANVEIALATEEVRHRADVASAENKLAEARESFQADGTATAESQRVFDEMKKAGRLP